jgi:two-component system response regulator FlrC
LDIVPLAHHILRSRAGSPQPGGFVLAESAVAQLMQHAWPGNVRELENVIQRAMILAQDSVIEAEHLNFPPCAAGRNGKENAAGAALDIKSMERTHIMETLAAVNGSRKLAVQRLGISERTLRYKLQQYRLAACG